MASANNVPGNQATESVAMPVPDAPAVVGHDDKELMERVAEIWKDLEVQLGPDGDFVEIDDMVFAKVWGDPEKEGVRELMM